MLNLPKVGNTDWCQSHPWLHQTNLCLQETILPKPDPIYASTTFGNCVNRWIFWMKSLWKHVEYLRIHPQKIYFVYSLCSIHYWCKKQKMFEVHFCQYNQSVLPTFGQSSKKLLSFFHLTLRWKQNAIQIILKFLALNQVELDSVAIHVFFIT